MNASVNLNAKYQRWGWVALIGLIIVIIVAGLVVAVNMTAPKKSSSSSDDNASLVAGDITYGGEPTTGNNNSGTDNTSAGKKPVVATPAEPVQDNMASEMPKTGPEENLISLVALATIAALAVYNVNLVKRNA